jgi:hypothetical protein
MFMTPTLVLLEICEKIFVTQMVAQSKIFVGLLPSEWAKLPIEYDENPLQARGS